jgi:hypothetical protein
MGVALHHRDVRVDLYKAHQWLFGGLCALANRLRDARCAFLFAELAPAAPAADARVGLDAPSTSVVCDVAESVLRDLDEEQCVAVDGARFVLCSAGRVRLRLQPLRLAVGCAGLPEEIELRGFALLKPMFDHIPSPNLYDVAGDESCRPFELPADLTAASLPRAAELRRRFDKVDRLLSSLCHRVSLYLARCILRVSVHSVCHARAGQRRCVITPEQLLAACAVRLLACGRVR